MAAIRDATLGDLDQVYELLERRSRAAFGLSELARADAEADLRRPGVDRWLAEVEGEVVGYAHLTSTHDLVHAAREPDVGDALLAHAEVRARERGFAAIEAVVVPEDVPFSALVQRSGFVHEREILRMWRILDGDPPEPEWPSGIAVRSYADGDAERVHALLDESYAAWDSTYVAQAHSEWLAFMTDHAEFDPELWFLAERGGRLVGCALHWREHQRRGWLKDIAVRGSERGNGLGTALIHHGLRAYAKRGAERVGLKVDASNPTGAPRLYERLGFAVDRRYGVWRKHL